MLSKRDLVREMNFFLDENNGKNKGEEEEVKSMVLILSPLAQKAINHH